MMNYGTMIFGIVEKMRWSPFHQPMKCEAAEPSAMRLLNSMSAPSPLAESLGLVPGNPPFGAYLNMTSSLACRNPNQVDITMKAQGSSFSIYAPNLTDLAVGGEGLPEALTGTGHLMSDVHLSAGGGTADMTQLTQVSFPLSAMLEMMAIASVQGYAPGYVKSVTPMRSCMSILGLPLCTETVTEQWCGSYSGSCMAKVLGTDGLPVDPVQYEPAMCAYTKAICGSKADMKAELTPSAVGLEVVATLPCPPTSGLPNTTLCNVISAPGIDTTTFEPKIIDPPTQLTANAQREMDKQLADAEKMVTIFTVFAIVSGAVGGSFFFVLSIFCVWRWRSGHAQAKELPIILSGGPTKANA